MLLDFHSAKIFRNLRFKRFLFGQKMMNQLIQRFVNKDPDKTLIGFGDWSARDAGIKGHPKGPVLKFKRALTRVCTVVDIDEFRTSQLHSECHYRMKR